MKNLVPLIFTLMLSGCAVIGRDLPRIDLENLKRRDSEKLSIYVDLKTNTQHGEEITKNGIKDALMRTGRFESISFVKVKDYDLKFKIRHLTGGFFEPYCVFTLFIIPCVPPFRHAIAVNVQSADGESLGKYFYKEDAIQFAWALGFLVPAVWDQSNRSENVISNMYYNLLRDLQADEII